MLALKGCVITRSSDGNIELVEAGPAHRVFPSRVNETLGVCLKLGAAHPVSADGKKLTYPSDALCIRRPGCVWSTADTGLASFVSLDIDSSLLPQGLRLGSMVFAAREAVPDFVPYVSALRVADAVQSGDIVSALILALERAGVVSADELREAAPQRTASQAREALEAAIFAPPSLVELARALGTNRFALMREFKLAFGITPHAFLLRLRIERAREQLARGAQLVDLALELGFADQAHFCRNFRRVTGMTPGQYARSARRRAGFVGRTFVQDP